MPKESDSTLPPTGTRCTDVLQDTLNGYAGVQNAALDLPSGKLTMDYDPQVLADKDAVRLVRRAGEHAYGRVVQCAARSEEACAECAAQMNANLAENYRKFARIGSTQMQFRDGRMEISLAVPAGSATAPEWRRAQVDLAGDDLLEPGTAAVEKTARPGRPALDRGRLEILFTVINALTAVLAFLGARYGFLPPVAVAILYGVAYGTGGYYGLLDGLDTLRNRKLDVNLLMLLAAAGAAAIGQPAEGAALLFLFSLSNTLQTYAMDRSRKAIEKLLYLRPPVATVRRGSRLVSLPVEKLVLGDVVQVKPGERIPIDGEVIAGASAVDQAAITGESIPVEKETGSLVFAGTVNGTGSIEIQTTRLAKDTTLAKIVQMVEEAQSSKAHTQRMLDNFEQFYALIVLGAAALLIIIPYFFLNADFYPTFYQAMTLLVVASPCALVISTPASILSAIANGARRGVLFK
ncbi:MAG TPA: HAD-IC family P-type ATPase, partial [Anaerolineales bacterium]|nr:HAD-IC family P-type ATPase [Anaerolineales bacterium]